MGKKKQQNEEKKESVVQPERHVQNEAPIMWQNFDQFWNASIKNGSDSHKEACKLHLKSLGIFDKPHKWIEGVLHFGIKIEK